jgi:quercetin dioxygenase-like cupin family protein
MANARATPAPISISFISSKGRRAFCSTNAVTDWNRAATSISPREKMFAFAAALRVLEFLFSKSRIGRLQVCWLRDPLWARRGTFLGDEDARLQVLLPAQAAFDLAINILTFQPGTTSPFVESHFMEHGLFMLRGQGIYRLEGEWHPVREGDVLWMAPYCPHWFVAVGKAPASFIYYQDFNRDPT